MDVDEQKKKADSATVYISRREDTHEPEVSCDVVASRA
jgi:hypothetical protein